MNEPPGATGSVRQAELCAAVDDAFEREQVPLLRRLVEMPSHTGAKADVEAAAAVLDEAAHAAGLRMRRVPDPQGVYADHRVYTTSACGDGDRSLALIGHIDTVFPRSLGFLAFARDDGPDGPGTGDLVRGPGVLDMKSGLTAMLGAIAAVRRVYGDDAQALCLRMIINSDEEVGSPSSEPLLPASSRHTSPPRWSVRGRSRRRSHRSPPGQGRHVRVLHRAAARPNAR
ncbi:MAG: M20/M25/M40 family metallo-hydrolase [Deltaproteobacteria bacterium]|nr:M20/M25/M40 family metallo-hydrolase [Deltaproteobacteria bacterium]